MGQISKQVMPRQINHILLTWSTKVIRTCKKKKNEQKNWRLKDRKKKTCTKASVCRHLVKHSFFSYRSPLLRFFVSLPTFLSFLKIKQFISSAVSAPTKWRQAAALCTIQQKKKTKSSWISNRHRNRCHAIECGKKNVCFRGVKNVSAS